MFFISDDEISNDEISDEEPKKPTLKKWDFLLGAAIVQQLNNSLTGTPFFSFPFPLYLLIIFSFFDLYLYMLSKKIM